MALEALNWKDHTKFDHKPQHDLESLFYVLVTVCTYVDAPGYLRSPVPLKTELSIPANEWWSTFDRRLLARVKSGQVNNLDDQILSRLSPYWKDFHPVLEGLKKAIWGTERVTTTQENAATHDAILNVLKTARDLYRDQNEELCAFAPTSENEDANSISQKRKNRNLDVGKGGSKRIRTHSTGSLSRSRPGPSQTRLSQTGAVRQGGYRSQGSIQFIHYT